MFSGRIFIPVRACIVYILYFFAFYQQTGAQSITQGGLAGGVFGVNSAVIAGQTFSPAPAGTVDWFKNATGTNVINQTNSSTIQALLQNPAIVNPTYIRRLDGGILSKVSTADPSIYRINIDAVWARDNFGGTGALDTTAYVVSSKNGQDPALWSPGIGNVLGKNDLIDVGGHMFRAVNGAANNLWFVGFINRAEPGGDAYMDFEFFIRDVGYDRAKGKFPTGGPDRGHTAFKFDASGNIIQLGDMIYNFSLSGGGTTPGVEVRIWVSRTDFNARGYQQGLKSIIGDTVQYIIYFDFDKYDLTKNSFDILTDAVDYLKKNDEYNVVLIGHTDLEGDVAYNIRLSQNRVSTAKNYLMSYGIQSERISTTFHGKSKPAIPTYEKSLAWKNRRVEIFLVKK